MKQRDVAAIIVAAGSSSRYGGNIPKQYEILGGKSLLLYSVEVLLTHPTVSRVLLVINQEHHAFVAALKLSSRVEIVIGGASRQQSVNNGLKALQDKHPHAVLIHDAARPFITAQTIDALLVALETSEGAIPASPVADTLKKNTPAQTIEKTVERHHLWAAQTPQAFNYAKIFQAHSEFSAIEATDDAQLVELAGFSVALVPHSRHNFKITTQEDMQMAEALIAQTKPRQQRIGQGVDVHAFTEGDFVTLCGVKIPHTHALKGHSDADVALHALTDALLGTIGAGDIGVHFPPSDDQWKNADSLIFLRHAVKLLHAKGAEINNIDVTILCERPKILPHRAAMVAVLMKELGLSEDQVSVKATTTEKLGFLGREEGIAAMAVVSVVV
jgi:2-C-methyl-D-erythritol 4-phosphate cytidylyltransferase/2-C-methyl-D-erythritol 2,4-cyclodiphosphate synthase